MTFIPYELIYVTTLLVGGCGRWTEVHMQHLGANVRWTGLCSERMPSARNGHWRMDNFPRHGSLHHGCSIVLQWHAKAKVLLLLVRAGLVCLHLLYYMVYSAITKDTMTFWYVDMIRIDVKRKNNLPYKLCMTLNSSMLGIY